MPSFGRILHLKLHVAFNVDFVINTLLVSTILNNLASKLGISQPLPPASSGTLAISASTSYSYSNCHHPNGVLQAMP